MSTNANQELIDRVLTFWLVETPETTWFMGNAELDNTVKSKFEQDVLRARNGELDDLHSSSALGSLALIILLDQFSRNIFRDDPRAFDADNKTLKMVYDGLERGYDKELAAISIHHALFFLLPLMHAEDLEAQDLSVAKLKEHNIVRALPAADSHREPIRKFGRFPHRNKVLGRVSTKEEEDYLNSDNALFGNKK